MKIVNKLAQISNRIMMWLSSPKNRMGVAFGLVILLAVLFGTGCSTTNASHSDDPVVQAQEAQQYEVAYIERAMYARMETGEMMVCMLTGMNSGFTNVPGWIGFTCAQLDKPLEWQFCAGKEGSPIMLCAPPATRIQGATAAPFEADVRMGVEAL